MNGHKISIGGKERGIQFGMGAIEIYCDTLECDLEGLDWIFAGGKAMLKAIPALVFAGLTNYQELLPEGVEETYTVRQIQQWLDDCTPEEYSVIIEIWKKSKYMGKTIEGYYFDSTQSEQKDTPQKKTKKK